MRWLEERGFEIVGGWVTTTVEPGLKASFGRLSSHHEWRAELLGRCLPETRDYDPERLTTLGGPPEWHGVVAQWRDQPDDSTRLVALAATLGTLIKISEDWLAEASPIRDALALRWVRLVLADQRTDAAEVTQWLDRTGLDRV